MSFTGLGYDDDNAAQKGMVAVWAYHCIRCNYVWLPKDYDFGTERTEDREAPKSCAKCKSKYWNSYPRDDLKGKPYSNTKRTEASRRRQDERKQSYEEKLLIDKIV
ncbi:MAG TPA: hypothetical protein VJ729_08325 [Nitrososphaeraceae archaeon]|nr:hypothetical protein [Nitrososphaeraceae archaeon]